MHPAMHGIGNGNGNGNGIGEQHAIRTFGVLDMGDKEKRRGHGVTQADMQNANSTRLRDRAGVWRAAAPERGC